MIFKLLTFKLISVSSMIKSGKNSLYLMLFKFSNQMMFGIDDVFEITIHKSPIAYLFFCFGWIGIGVRDTSQSFSEKSHFY